MLSTSNTTASQAYNHFVTGRPPKELTPAQQRQRTFEQDLCNTYGSRVIGGMVRAAPIAEGTQKGPRADGGGKRKNVAATQANWRPIPKRFALQRQVRTIGHTARKKKVAMTGAVWRKGSSGRIGAARLSAPGDQLRGQVRPTAAWRRGGVGQADATRRSWGLLDGRPRRGGGGGGGG